MEGDFVIVTEGDGDASLGVLGRGLAQGVFGDDEDGSGVGQFDCGTETGDAGANYEKVAVHRHCDSNNVVSVIWMLWTRGWCGIRKNEPIFDAFLFFRPGGRKPMRLLP